MWSDRHTHSHMTENPPRTEAATSGFGADTSGHITEQKLYNIVLQGLHSRPYGLPWLKSCMPLGPQNITSPCLLFNSGMILKRAFTEQINKLPENRSVSPTRVAFRLWLNLLFRHSSTIWSLLSLISCVLLHITILRALPAAFSTAPCQEHPQHTQHTPAASQSRGLWSGAASSCLCIPLKHFSSTGQSRAKWHQEWISVLEKSNYLLPKSTAASKHTHPRRWTCMTALKSARKQGLQSF